MRVIIALAMLLMASVTRSAPEIVAPPTPMQLGVTTHFSQGWPISLLDKAKALGVTTIRDSLHWAAIESVPGRYDFSEAKTRHVTKACAMGMNVLLGIDPRNRIYDGGATANSPQARAAFAGYILAIADRFPDCVIAVQIGNEINGRNGITGPAAANRALSHTALLRDIYQRVKPKHPELIILGGSTNAIGTGFLETLFAAGALAYMDGVVVHPYRREPEAVEWELARLQAAMARSGGVKPIWANEFGRDFPDPTEAPDFFLKMTTLMGGAGVANAYWYALIDQKWFPTMGLVTAANVDKPVASTFTYVANILTPRGRPVRIDAGDPSLFHYRFGHDRNVIWGTRRKLDVMGSAIFRNSSGTIVPRPSEVSSTPIIIEGLAPINIGPAEILADSRYGFGREPFSYHINKKATGLRPLEPIDWTWGSYFGSRTSRAIQITSLGIGPAGGGKAPIEAIVRFTATASLPVIASLCLEPVAAGGDGVSVSITHNGITLWRGRTSPGAGTLNAQAATAVKSGDVIDFTIGPNGNAVRDRMHYHYRVSRLAKDAASC
jgi:hypothetical protein